MKSFKRMKCRLFILSLATCGCASSSYRIADSDSNRVELKVTPDRIVLECESLFDADEKGLFGFMIHILDEKKTVMTVVQTNTLDQEGCLHRFDNIGKILKQGKLIYIGGMGDLNDARVETELQYSFPAHGTFHDNGRSLQFGFIMNEAGRCYSAQDADEPPCPPSNFPIH